MKLSFFHGWGMQPAIWQDLQARLGGGSTPTLHAGPGSLDDWADRLAPELPEGGAIIAWSLGAMLALALAARHPARVRRLVLFAATPSFAQRADWPHGLDTATLHAFRSAFQRDGARTQERFLALQVLGEHARHPVSTALRAALDNAGAHSPALAHGLRLLEESDLRNHLPAASLRCLLIHGAQDALVPAAASAWLAQRWPASETLILPESGHAPFLSEPEMLAQRIRQFLDD